jgi:autotransporter-associated beta strand protein
VNHRFLFSSIVLLACAFLRDASGADNWTGGGSTPNWSDNDNWDAGVPATGADVAFGASAQTSVVQDVTASVSSLTFGANAPAYTITLLPSRSTTLTGSGVTNNSPATESMLTSGAVIRGPVGSSISFINSAGAGTITIDNSGGQTSGARGGAVSFFGAASAGNATLVNRGGAVPGAHGGEVVFSANATAASAVITTTGGADTDATGGTTFFYENSSAQNSTLTTDGPQGGASGGLIRFFDNADGGLARAITNTGATFDITGLLTSGMSIGSIEGGGIYSLGAKRLTVGGNNLSTTMSGVLQDGGLDGGTGAGLTKNGTGTLTLSGTNTYSGTTVVAGGTLLIAPSGSLGFGAIDVNANAVLVVNGIVHGNTDVSGTAGGAGTFGGNVLVKDGGTFNGAATVSGNLTLQATGLVSLSSGSLVVNGSVTNDGTMRFRHGASFNPAGGTFINNGTLDVITGAFLTPANFVNNGIVLDASVVKTKSITRSGAGVTIAIGSYAMHTYQLQRSPLPTSNSFFDVGAPQSGATGTTLTFTDASAPSPRAFYRIAVDP